MFKPQTSGQGGVVTLDARRRCLCLWTRLRPYHDIFKPPHQRRIDAAINSERIHDIIFGRLSRVPLNGVNHYNKRPVMELPAVSLGVVANAAKAAAAAPTEEAGA